MNTSLPSPTVELVKAACKEFDRDNLIDEALVELFSGYPGNADIRHVLLKVAALNSLYSTQIFAVVAVARHIHQNYQNIDSAIAAGSPKIVDSIARITLSGKERCNYSFATKYCSWHNPAAYPIWDSRVDKYLWSYQKQDRFAAFIHADLWNYPRFREVMIGFRTFYRLDSFTFKEIDKFLWWQGEAPPTVV